LAEFSIVLLPDQGIDDCPAPPEPLRVLSAAKPLARLDAGFACGLCIGHRIEVDEIFNSAPEPDEKNAEDSENNARG